MILNYFRGLILATILVSVYLFIVPVLVSMAMTISVLFGVVIALLTPVVIFALVRRWWFNGESEREKMSHAQKDQVIASLKKQLRDRDRNGDDGIQPPRAKTVLPVPPNSPVHRVRKF